VKRPNSSILIVGVAVASLFGWPLAGCTDVGDDIGTDGGAVGGDATSSGALDSGEVDAIAEASVAAQGSDGSGAASNTPEAGAESPGSGEDAGVEPATSDGGVSAPLNTEGPPPTTTTEPSGNTEVDAGGEPTVFDAGANAVVDAGGGEPTVVDAGANPTVDTGAEPTIDAGIDATIGEPSLDAGVSGAGAPDTGPGPIDASVDARVAEAGPAEAGVVDAGLLDAGGAACVGGVSNVCPISNPVCINGLTQGIGTASGGCNQTESAILQIEGESCLECLLNFSCLHDMQGDNPSTDHPDCDDLSGTVPAGAAAGAGTSLETDCLDLLTCELQSKCGKGNTLDCYCGVGVNSTTCKTSQIGACVSEEQVGLESTDPNFIQANATLFSNVNGGVAANVILNCAKNNCDTVCFQ
jgi:hypothetical protein